MRAIGVVTVGRSDYSYLCPILKAIQGDPSLKLQLFVSGMHLSQDHGYTFSQIERDGFPIAERIEMLLSSDSPTAIAKAIGVGTIGFAQSFERTRPDILLMLGDRFELLSAAGAALPYTIPIAHIHGGESTEGLIDEAVRHALTKMSHLHFVSTEFYSQRIIRMGEEPWRVSVTGAPTLDNLRRLQPASQKELEKMLGIDLSLPTLLVTYHPVTLEYLRTEEQVGELLAALAEFQGQILFTYPNADTANQTVLRRIRAFAGERPKTSLHVNLGVVTYFSLLGQVTAMVGNSSSGIIEAASFRLPVVNVGIRQRGRFHGENVIDVGERREEIASAIRRAVSPAFRDSLRDLVNPYGDGHASERILGRLKEVALGSELILKRYYSGGIG